MRFSEVAGQQKVKNKLITSVRANRIPHAQLLFGPQGCGNLPLAIAYAQFVACEDRGEDDSCGKCASCQKFQKLIHPDLHFSFPFNSTKRINKALDKIISDEFINEWREKVLENPYFSEKEWYYHIDIENKQGIIGKSEGDNIAKKLMYKPYESDYKFMIIWLPENMNTKSANSLLKLIEEPPNKTIFLFVSDNVNAILPTIFSRTQPIKLNPIDSENMLSYFSSKTELTDEQLHPILKLANGNIIKASELLEQSEQTSAYLDRFKEMMRLSWKRDMQAINSWIDEIATTGREQLKNYFSYALHMIRENYMMHAKTDEIVFMTTEENNFSTNFHPYINGRNVLSITKILNQAAIDIGANAYAKIVLLDTILKLSRTIKK